MAKITCFSSIFFFVALSIFPLLSLSADPDLLQDFCVADLKAAPISVNGFPCKPAVNVTSEDFFFEGLSKEVEKNAFGVGVVAGNVLAFPGLNTLGISMNRVDLAVGALNQPHSHPRASESGVVIKGKVLVGFVTTGNVFYSKVLKKGGMFVVPRGLVHFQMNVGKNEAMLVTAFNSQLPGSAVVAPTLFASKPSVPDQVLTKAFQVDQSVIDEIKSKFNA